MRLPLVCDQVKSLKMRENIRLIIIASINTQEIISNNTCMICSSLNYCFWVIQHHFPFLFFQMIEVNLVRTNFNFDIFPLGNVPLASKNQNYILPNVETWTWKWVRKILLTDLYSSPRERIQGKVNGKTIKMNFASVPSKNPNFWSLSKNQCIFSWNWWFPKNSSSLPIPHFLMHAIKNLIHFLHVCQSFNLKIRIMIDKTIRKLLRI